MNKTFAKIGAIALFVIFSIFVFALFRPSYETKKFATEAKKVINPTDLQNWAIEVLKTNMSGSVANKDIPQNIRNLTSQGQSISFATRNVNSVTFVWTRFIGGAWGIEVGPQTFKPFNPTGIYYIEWQPGVYFWHDK